MKTIEQLEAEIKERQEQIEALKRRDGKYPADGETVYHLCNDGSLWEEKWGTCYWEKDSFSQGNVSRSREVLEREAKERALRTKLRKLAGGWEPDWKNNKQEKCCIYYSHKFNRPVFSIVYTAQDLGEVYFPTDDAVQAAIEATCDDWIKLYGGSDE